MNWLIHKSVVKMPSVSVLPLLSSSNMAPSQLKWRSFSRGKKESSEEFGLCLQHQHKNYIEIKVSTALQLHSNYSLTDHRSFLMTNGSSQFNDTNWFQWQFFGGFQSVPCTEILMRVVLKYMSKLLFGTSQDAK